MEEKTTHTRAEADASGNGSHSPSRCGVRGAASSNAIDTGFPFFIRTTNYPEFASRWLVPEPSRRPLHSPLLPVPVRRSAPRKARSRGAVTYCSTRSLYAPSFDRSRSTLNRSSANGGIAPVCAPPDADADCSPNKGWADGGVASARLHRLTTTTVSGSKMPVFLCARGRFHCSVRRSFLDVAE
jgi:hypothetical protein